MIHITSKSYDILGHISFHPSLGNAPATFSRRVTRAATLDGGVAISDRGYSEGDATLVYRYKPVSREHDERAYRLLKLHPRVRVSNPDGLFEAVIESFEPSPSENTITLLVIEKLSED